MYFGIESFNSKGYREPTGCVLTEDKVLKKFIKIGTFKFGRWAGHYGIGCFSSIALATYLQYILYSERLFLISEKE